MAAAKRYASNAERQKAYRERQRNGVSVTDAAKPEDPQLAEWRRWYHPDVYAVLVQIAEQGGMDVARLATQALTRALDEERAWAAVRDLDGTTQGYNLKLLVKRKDPRVVQFLDDCKYLR